MLDFVDSPDHILLYVDYITTIEYQFDSLKDTGQRPWPYECA